MALLEFLKLALFAITRNKMRAFLTMLGIIVGVGAVIAMIGIGEGSKRASLAIIENMGSNMLTIRPGALKNLIDNAIKFSTNKKAIIEANKSFIKVISQGEPLKNELSFYTDAFYQEDKRSSGFGLGLYIVKAIVNLHKFSLDYEYVDGKNCFIIKF